VLFEEALCHCEDGRLEGELVGVMRCGLILLNDGLEARPIFSTPMLIPGIPRLIFGGLGFGYAIVRYGRQGRR